MNVAKKAIKESGILLGKILKIFPIAFKKKITVILEKLISISKGKLNSSIYILGNEIIKHMYFAKDKNIFLEKKIFDGLKIRLDVSQKTQRILYIKKIYEPYIYNYLVKNLKSGDTFLDIGANVGFYAILGAGLVGQNGQIVAFEPEKKNFSSLTANVKLNNLKNVDCVNKAVSKNSKKSRLFINPLNDGGASLLKSNSYNDDKEKWSLEKIKKYFPKENLEQDIETVSLDQFLTTGKIKTNIDIIKIDVEGNELNVIMGMQKILGLSDAPKIICEMSQNKNKIIDILKKYNYKISVLEGKNFLFSKSF